MARQRGNRTGNRRGGSEPAKEKAESQTSQEEKDRRKEAKEIVQRLNKSLDEVDIIHVSTHGKEEVEALFDSIIADDARLKELGGDGLEEDAAAYKEVFLEQWDDLDPKVGIPGKPETYAEPLEGEEKPKKGAAKAEAPKAGGSEPKLGFRRQMRRATRK